MLQFLHLYNAYGRSCSSETPSSTPQGNAGDRWEKWILCPSRQSFQWFLKSKKDSFDGLLYCHACVLPTFTHLLITKIWSRTDFKVCRVLYSGLLGRRSALQVLVSSSYSPPFQMDTKVPLSTRSNGNFSLPLFLLLASSITQPSIIFFNYYPPATPAQIQLSHHILPFLSLKWLLNLASQIVCRPLLLLSEIIAIVRDRRNHFCIPLLPEPSFIIPSWPRHSLLYKPLRASHHL